MNYIDWKRDLLRREPRDQADPQPRARVSAADVVLLRRFGIVPYLSHANGGDCAVY